MSIFVGMFAGFIAWFLVRYLVAGLYTVQQNERAVKTSFGRAQRIGNATIQDDPISESLNPEERERYVYPQVQVIPAGGPSAIGTLPFPHRDRMFREGLRGRSTAAAPKGP